MRTQTQSNRLLGDFPDTEQSSPYTASIAYFPGSYPTSATPVGGDVQSGRSNKNIAEPSEWWSTGVLHDFNNLLAIILSHSSIALAKLPADHPAHSYVERAVRATKRAADISSQLLVDVNRQWAEPVIVNLNAVVQDTVDLIEHKLKNKAEIHLQMNEGVKPIIAHITQMQQVMMNLLLNAAEAIEKPMGKVTITTGNWMIPETRQPILPNSLPPGDYVFLQVTDTGIGMDQARINRIFEAQFTTKPTGSGSGLTATLAIIHAHQGGIRVFSAPGRGTTFQVFLPAATDQQLAAVEGK